MGIVSGADVAVKGRTRATVFTVALLALALLLPQVVSNYSISVMIRMLIMALMAMSFTLLAGYGGLLSLGQVLFRGITAYTITIGIMRHGWGPEYAIAVSLVFTVGFSILFGWIARNLAWLYFLMMSLAVGQLGWILALNRQNLTGGFEGIHGLPGLTLFNLDLTSNSRYYYFVLVAVFLCYLALKRITTSPFGITLQGVRDNPVRMASIGFNVRWQKHLAIVLSSFFAGLSGVLYVFYYKSVTPDMLQLNAAVTVLFVALLGGVGRIEGGIIGAIVYILIDDFGRTVTRHHLTVLGVFFIVMVLFFPGGIISLKETVEGWLSRTGRREGKGVVPPPG